MQVGGGRRKDEEGSRAVEWPVPALRIAGLSIQGKVEDLMIRRVAIIGAGGFGEVMLAAMTGPEERAQEVELVASHRRPERRAELQEKYGITVYADNWEACEGADVIYPVVRPDQMGTLMKEIGPGIGDGQIVAAGAASLPLSYYRRYLSSKCTLAWVFPTSYMSLRLGYLALCPEPGSDPERIRDLESYWGHYCEHVITIREEAMDTFVLLHAAGQTFIWPVLKAFVEFGSANGFTSAEAQAITLSTLESMARCLKTQDASPIALEGMMEEYSVPRSLTESGIAVLRRNYVESIYAQTLEAGMTQARVNREEATRSYNPQNTA